ncbi:MAG: HEPN domain-containing protein [Nitrososphaerota archaeon]
MSGFRKEAKDWFDGAMVDLEEARSALLNNRVNWALFAAHQAVEKALKSAFMILKRERPPRTHDLVRLLGELGLELPENLRTGISELSPYYVLARYPNAGLERPWESIDRTLAEKLINVAEEVVRSIGRVTGLG